MPTKIRLQRRGKKGQAFYHIVIADGRAPRDGKFIEQIGIYNPITRPAEIEINFDKAMDWLTKGAQPTPTVKAILSYKGVLYKFHLLKGVKKGAMTTEQAEAKFQTWLDEKQAKISSATKEVELKAKDNRKKQQEAEIKVNEAKAEAIAKKLEKIRLDKAAKAAEAAPEAIEPPAAETPVAEAPAAEAPTAETPAEPTEAVPQAE
jgi:small subunit ribosomal protein S16